MRYYCLLTAFIFTTMSSFGQNTFPSSGNVGIGTTSPIGALNVIGTSSTSPEINADHYFNNFGASTLNLKKARGTSSVPLAVQVNDWISALDGWGHNGTTFFRTNYIGSVVTGAPTASGIPTDLVFATNSGGSDALERIRITSQGNVGIGTNDTKGYKLAVAGNMITESVKVKLQGAWPDYVFLPSYKVPTLQEIEKHIKEKGHLPGIPSASEVKANGVDLGDMNAKLLQKIEELTLHLIEKEKKEKLLQEKVETIEEKLNMLLRKTDK